MRIARFVISNFLLSIPFAPDAVQAASFTVIDDLPVGILRILEAPSLSADGSTVVGTALTDSRERRAFLWDADSGFRLIDGFPSGTIASGASDVSADGSTVTGTFGGSQGGGAFVWDAVNGVRGLGDLPGGVDFGRGLGISDDGMTVVGQGVKGGELDFLEYETIVWEQIHGLEGLSQLPGGADANFGSAVSSDGSRITGARYASASGIPEAFVWEANNGVRGLGDLPVGEFSSVGYAISADGTTVVGYGTGEPDLFHVGGRRQAVIWDETQGMRPLGSLFGDQYESIAFGVSADGSVVVGTDNDPSPGGGIGGLPHSKAFIWDEANGMQALDVLLTSLGIDLTGWELVDARSVSADGRTDLGFGLDPTGQTRAFVAVIPEPGTAILLGIGLGLMAAGMRLRSQDPLGLIPGK